MKAYSDFLLDKSQLGDRYGFTPIWMPDSLFDFQQSLTEWALLKGRGAVYADCGLGKTPIQLTWAHNIILKTNKPALILTPLAVSHQTVREGEKFDIECKRSEDGQPHRCITVTNYERLHLFNANDYAGVVCDESSILKNFDGTTKQAVTEFMRKVPYRLLCTATAAPNDYTELGTSSEALGELGYTDMLSRFFKNDQGTIKPMRYTGFGNPRTASPQGRDHTDKWRFKGHAELPFWRWVCSWARSIRKPSDLGFSDGRFVLPPLSEEEHCVVANRLAPGALFAMPAVGLDQQREERRRTIPERCDKVAQLADTKKQVLIWCHLNDEGDRLEKSIPGAVQVKGSDSDDKKTEALLGFADGHIRALITKPKIGAFGLNFQKCAHITFFPSHSFEQYYQGVRRCWRFGQDKAVKVDVITTEGERDVLQNLKRKAAAADVMFSRLVEEINRSLRIEARSNFSTHEEVPAWL